MKGIPFIKKFLIKYILLLVFIFVVIFIYFTFGLVENMESEVLDKKELHDPIRVYYLFLNNLHILSYKGDEGITIIYDLYKNRIQDFDMMFSLGNDESFKLLSNLPRKLALQQMLEVHFKHEEMIFSIKLNIKNYEVFIKKNPHDENIDKIRMHLDFSIRILYVLKI